MDVFTQDVPRSRFFVTANAPPANVFQMLARPLAGVVEEVGLAICIHDESYWHVNPGLLVRLLREDEHEQKIFSRF